MFLHTDTASIPRSIGLWYDWDLWHLNPGNYWVIMQEEFHRRIMRPTRKALEPYGYFEEKKEHEMAHLIESPDEKLGDPFWGNDTWTFRAGDDKLFDDDATYRELEVLTIEMKLRNFFSTADAQVNAAEWAALEMTVHQKIQGFEKGPGGTMTQLWCKEQPVFPLLHELAKGFDAKWSVEAMWEERCRKTDLALRLQQQKA